MALRETQRSTKFNVPRRFPDARPISVLHQVQSILPVLNVYWTEVAEFCAAMRNQRESHAIRTKLAKNRKKRDPKKNEEKIYTKRKRPINEKKLANSTRSSTHVCGEPHVVPPRGDAPLAIPVDGKRFHILQQLPLVRVVTNYQFKIPICRIVATT